MITASEPSKLNKLSALLEKVIEAWALIGGILLLGVVLVTAVSMTGNILFHKPVPGDFEIVEVCIAIAAFSFLPYCQTTDSNVSADIFTFGAGPRLIAAFSLIASLTALSFSCLLLWRMSLGMLDYQKYAEVTMVYQFPLWVAFVPILISLFLLAVASVITLAKAWQGTCTGHHETESSAH